MFSLGFLKGFKWILDEILNNCSVYCDGIHPISVMQLEVVRSPLL